MMNHTNQFNVSKHAQSNVAIVANASTISAAIHSPAGEPEFHALKFIDAPFALLCPKQVFGFRTEQLTFKPRLGVARERDWDGSIYALIKRLCELAVPTTEDAQSESFRILAARTAQELRIAYNSNDDLGYLTDTIWLQARDEVWGVQNRLGDQTLRKFYGPIVEQSVHSAFNGVSLTEPEAECIRQYIYDVTCDSLSDEVVTMMAVGLQGRTPALEPIYFDQFVANAPKILRDMQGGTSRVPAGIIARYPERAGRIGDVGQSGTLKGFSDIAKNLVNAPRNVLDSTALGALMSAIFAGKNCQWFGEPFRDTLPPPLVEAGEDYIEWLATVLAQALSGPDAVSGYKGNTTTVLTFGGRGRMRAPL